MKPSSSGALVGVAGRVMVGAGPRAAFAEPRPDCPGASAMLIVAAATVLNKSAMKSKGALINNSLKIAGILNTDFPIVDSMSRRFQIPALFVAPGVELG
jgi:hypothetical protein